MVSSGSNWMHSYGYEGRDIFLLNSYVSFAIDAFLVIIFVLITIDDILFILGQIKPSPNPTKPKLSRAITLFFENILVHEH